MPIRAVRVLTAEVAERVRLVTVLVVLITTIVRAERQRLGGDVVRLEVAEEHLKHDVAPEVRAPRGTGDDGAHIGGAHV